MKTWVYIDHFKGEIVHSSWEALGVGKTYGAVTALIFGNNVGKLADMAFEYGADDVILVEDPDLEDFRAEAYAATLTGLVKSGNPDLVLLPTTFRAREMSAMSAIDLNTGVIVDATGLENQNETIVVTRPIYEGKLLEKTSCSQKPAFITLRGRAFPRPERIPGLKGNFLKGAANVTAQTTVEGYSAGETGVSISDAGVVVAGGRGVSNNPSLGLDEKATAEKGFTMIGELASTLGGAVGASRAVVDAGFIPYSHQVGQTGKVVSPDLYIAAGISGSIQHIVGIRTAKLVIAVNKDAEAPIFSVARYGIVGDLFTYIPLITAAFKKKTGK